MTAAAKVLILKELRRAVLSIARALDMWIMIIQGKDIPAGG